MSKKEDFKEFIRKKPELVNYIKNKEMTMQGFYEIYDIYGEDEKAWSPYLVKENESTVLSPQKFGEIIKNLDLDTIEKHINTAQKALGVVGDLTSKNTVADAIKGPLTSRPLNKFFED